MANPSLGHITCPHCGNDQATVHRESRGRRPLYYRCYGGPHGDCGTIQARYEGGQKWIKDNARWFEGDAQDKAAQEAAEEAAEETAEAIREQRRERAQERRTEAEEAPRGRLGDKLREFLTG